MYNTARKAIFRKLIINICLYKTTSIEIGSIENPWYCYEYKKGIGELWVRRLTINPISNINVLNYDSINTMFVFVFKEKEKYKANIFMYYIYSGKTVMYDTVYDKNLVWKNLKK